MAELELRTRKWGSSLGIIIPKDVVEKEHISVNQKILVEIKKNRAKVKDIFGMFSEWKEHPDKIKKEMKEGWE